MCGYIVKEQNIRRKIPPLPFAAPLLIDQGNAGDSRGVLGIKGRAKPLSFDHKPQNDCSSSISSDIVLVILTLLSFSRACQNYSSWWLCRFWSSQRKFGPFTSHWRF